MPGWGRLLQSQEFVNRPLRSTTQIAMSRVDPELFLKWKRGLDAFNEFELEERRNASYRQRFDSLTRIWRQSVFLGHAEPKPPDLSVNDIWQRLRVAYSE